MKCSIKMIMVIMAAACIASVAYSAEYTLIQPFPGVEKVSSFPEYIVRIIPFVLGLAAVLAVVMIVIGGIQYAISEAVGQKEDAKDRIWQAIFGLLLALASYLILYTINPQLVNLQLTIPGLPSTKTNQLSLGGPTQFSCPAGQNNTFCDIGQRCVFEGPPVNDYICKAGNLIPQGSPGGACPVSGSGVPEICPPNKTCVLNDASQTYDCVDLSITRRQERQTQLQCIAFGGFFDFSGKNCKKLGGNSVPGGNCTAAFGVACPSGTFCCETKQQNQNIIVPGQD